MVSLGRKLRAAREQQALSLAEIASRTRIRLSYLEAIEQDQLDQIPGGFFSRSFVRQYAQALGLNGADINGDLEAVTISPVETVPVEKILRDYRPTKPALVAEDGAEFFHEAAFVKESNSGTIWMTLAVTLIFGSAGYLTWQQRPDLRAFVLGRTTTPAAVSTTSAPAVTPPATNVPNPNTDPGVPAANESQEPAASPTTAPPELTAANRAPALPLKSTAPSAGPVPSAAAPAASVAPPTSQPGLLSRGTASVGQTSPVEVAVSATEKSWVRLLSDGEKIFGGVMEAGETRRIAGSMSAVVFTGNAGGIQIRFNGQAIGAPGPRGQIRTVVLTPQNYEIRSSQPPPVSPSSPGVAGAAVREP